MHQIIYIKNMVCQRCIMAVKQVLTALEIVPNHVDMGEIELKEPLTASELDKLAKALLPIGFELLDNQKQQLIEKLKSSLIQKVQSGDIEEHFSISEYLSSMLLKEYSSISKLFSQVEGITIEQFFIQQKVEKVKELLIYGELTLNEISYQLGYSSVAHLSAQFKKVTGFTPSAFKKNGGTRKSLDQL
jgi:AraC-like DNA-binding protein